MRRAGTTLLDVAVQAGVSKTTAASILRDAPGFRVSGETRQRVLEVSQQLGYRRNAIATSLSLGRTQAVGVLLPPEQIQGETHALRVYGQDVFLAVFLAASRASLRVIPVPPSQTSGEPLSLNDVADRCVDGFILASSRNTAFREALEQAEIPCVEIGAGTGKYRVHPDNEAGAAAAVEHLVALGHRRIAHWHGGPGNFTSGPRGDGFSRAAQRLGITETTVVTALESVAELLRQPVSSRPTAIFCFNDYMGGIVLDIARSLDLQVPRDLSIVGFDDNVLAETARPALTTIHNPLNEQADRAIEVLQTLWRGEEPPPRQSIPTYLVVRGTTAAVAKAN